VGTNATKYATALGPVQYELFTAMSFVAVDPAFDDSSVRLAGKYINNASSMERFGLIHPDTIFDRVAKLNGVNDGQYQTWNLCGVQVTATPKRLRSFHNNMHCVECGRSGNVFLIERHANDRVTEERPDHHLNLYSVDEASMVLMTVDHILPDSWYGRYDPVNFQTMCRPCNQKKRDTMSVAEIEQVRANISLYAKAWVVPEFLDALLQLQLQVHEADTPTKKLALTRVMEKYRKRCKHTTKRPEVLAMLVAMNDEIAEAATSGGNVLWPNTNVEAAKQRDCTVASWKQRMKRWFVSLAAGLVGLHPVQRCSQAANELPTE
jgi:hypothetical protein